MNAMRRNRKGDGAKPMVGIHLPADVHRKLQEIAQKQCRPISHVAAMYLLSAFYANPNGIDRLNVPKGA